jgi:hypothetical protein
MPLLTTLVGLVVLQGAWKPYPIGSGFLAAFPSAPERMKEVEKENGNDSKIWAADHPAGHILLGSILDVETEPSAEDQQSDFLSEVLDGAVEDDKLLIQRDVVFEGWPGVEYASVDKEGMHSFGRFVLVKDQLVSLLAVGDTMKTEVPAKKFYESLRLPASVGKGRLSKAGPSWESYPIGETGISMNFPRKPEVGKNPKLSPVPGRDGIVVGAEFLNRSFIVSYAEAPASGIAGEEILKKANEANAAVFNAGPITTVPSKVAGQDSWKSTFTSKNGVVFARIESFRTGKWIVRATAFAPKCLAKSPEIDAFFTSATIK